MNGFRNLRRLGMSMQINCTVTKHNIQQIETLYAKARELGADALLQWANAQLGRTQRLSRLHFLDALPRSAIGKVLKRELRESWAAHESS